MDDTDLLAERFEANRGQLHAVAFRMLGSHGDADDAVQEAWLRVQRAGAGGVDNLGGWFTTIVGRICLDMLRTRTARREQPLPETAPFDADRRADPETQAVLADSVGLALLVVLDTLAPAERLAFVLHDLFAVSFEEIAPIVDRTPAATRQLASRARRRVRGASADASGDADIARRRQVVDAFLAAARDGDMTGLLAVLDPDVVVRSDRRVPMFDGTEVHGRQRVAGAFVGHANDARVVLLDGVLGAAWMPKGRLFGAMFFAVTDGQITAIDLVGDRAQLHEIVVTPLDA